MIAMHHAIYGRRYETITFTATSCTTFNMTIRFTGTISVNWGDGTTTTQTGSGVNLNYNKTYASTFTGTITIAGDLSGVLNFTSQSNTGVFLDVKELKKFSSLVYLDLRGNITINNAIVDLPRVTNTLQFQNLPNVTLTGSVIDLPRVTNTLYLLNLRNVTLTGSVIDLPRVTTSLYFRNLPNVTLTGSVIDLPRVTTSLYLENLPNVTLTGSVSDLPLSTDVYITSIGTTTLSYTGGTIKPTTKTRTFINISTKFTTAQTDAMLIDHATYSTTWSTQRQIYLSSLGRTTASDSAVATLTSRSVTITLV